MPNLNSNKFPFKATPTAKNRSELLVGVKKWDPNAAASGFRFPAPDKFTVKKYPQTPIDLRPEWLSTDEMMSFRFHIILPYHWTG